MRYWFLALGLFVTLPAQAQTAGEPCQKFGQTIVADDKKRVLACLRPTLGDLASPLIWMLNTSAPKAWQSSGDPSPEPFYTIGPEHTAGE